MGPDDEYDCLVHHIISSLHRGDSDIAGLIYREMNDHFGLSVRQEEADKVSIIDWWKNNKKI